MAELAAQYGVWAVGACFLVLLFAGFVKGVVGFALPMIVISGVGSVMSAEIAIAAVILPGLVTNMQQSARGGLTAARATLMKYWRMNLLLFLLIGIFAQFVVMLPDWVLFTILGGVVTATGAVQLRGWRPRFPARLTNRIEVLAGTLAGVFGGLTGVWGPPILLYLIARETPKAEVVRAQGIAFLIGSVILTGAHLVSGVLDQRTAPFSALLVLPAVAGLFLGRIVQDRLDQERFRRLTLLVLIVAGLNLIRRAVMG